MRLPNFFLKEMSVLTNIPQVLYNHSGGNDSAKHLDKGISQQDMKLTLTVEELANQLNISRGTAYNLVRKKDFYPAFRIGNRVLISVDALSSWIRDRTEGKA